MAEVSLARTETPHTFASGRRRIHVNNYEDFYLKARSQNLSLTVLYVPNSLDSSTAIDSGLVGSLRGAPREQKMLKGHLPGVIYHQVY